MTTSVTNNALLATCTYDAVLQKHPKQSKLLFYMFLSVEKLLDRHSPISLIFIHKNTQMQHQHPVP